MLDKINEWFKQAKPEPTQENAIQQLAYHFEEIAEMFEALGEDEMVKSLKELKLKYLYSAKANLVEKWDKKALLDSLGDQIVTSVGVGTYLGMDILGAVDEINGSNWSKFVDGKPLLDENGKITKGPGYYPPNLEKYL